MQKFIITVGRSRAEHARNEAISVLKGHFLEYVSVKAIRNNGTVEIFGDKLPDSFEKILEDKFGASNVCYQSDNGNEGLNGNNHQGSSGSTSQKACQRIRQLEIDLADANKSCEEYSSRVAELEPAAKRLETIESQGIAGLVESRDYDALKKLVQLSNRGDLYILDAIGSGAVNSLKNISGAYELALRETQLTSPDEITRLSRQASLTLDELLEGLGKKEEFEQARQALKMSEGGAMFIDTDSARNVVMQVKEIERKHKEKRARLQPLRDALEGNTVTYFMQTEESDEDYTINLVLPIQFKHEHSNLENDLISHVLDQWTTLSNQFSSDFKSYGRLGLSQYSFKVSKKNADRVRIRQLEDNLADALFENQTKYSFGVLGLKINLERLSFYDQDLPKQAPQEVVEEATEIQGPATQLPEPSETPSYREPSHRRTIRTQSEITEDHFYNLRSRLATACPDFPYNNLEYKPDKAILNDIGIGVLTALAEKDSWLKPSELRADVRILLGEAYDDRLKPRQSHLNQVINKFLENKSIERGGEPRNYLYRLNPNYRS